MRPEFIPTPLAGKRIVVTIEVTPEEHERLTAAARSHGVSLRRLVHQGALFALDHMPGARQ